MDIYQNEFPKRVASRLKRRELLGGGSIVFLSALFHMPSLVHASSLLYSAHQSAMSGEGNSTRAYQVYGAIRDKWLALGGVQGFGNPLTDETGVPDGIGRYNDFQNGSIYWSPSTGAHEVNGAIRDKWLAIGGPKGLGYPLTDEAWASDSIGRYNDFHNSSIYWSPSTGAHEVNGAIRDKWLALGGVKSYLGYPLTDEAWASDSIGRYNDFQNGSIYWSPSTGAVDLQNTQTWDVNSITFSDGTALGGNCHLVMNHTGDWTFSGHMHDSGFDTYSFGITAVVLTPSGIAYTLQIAGRAEGTSAGLPFGTPHRDYYWTKSGNNPSVRDNWMLAAQAKVVVHAVAQDKLASSITDVLKDAVQVLESEGVSIAVTTLVTLLA